MADSIKATPQNPYLAPFARGLRSLQELASQYQVDPRVPLLGGASVDELLSLPGAASLLEDVSYNGPRALIKGGNAATGGIGTFRLDPRVVDVADVVTTAAPLGALATREAKRIGTNLVRSAPYVARDIAESMAAPMRSYVIKPKGGNWLAGQVERAVEPIRQTTPGHGTPWEAENLETNAPRLAINKWLDQKLTRYIKNEMATPEDPIRALAERGVLHVDPEQLPADLGRMTLPSGDIREVMGRSPLAKRWESASDYSIYNEPAGTAAERSSKLVRENPWLLKVPPETRVYAQTDLTNIKPLGFDHLVDELKNAMRPDSDLPDRLRIDPAKLDKMTVPQVVEKVSQINAWRAAQKADADLARAGNAATVEHKAYDVIPGTTAPNERGLRWVELRMPEFNAENLPSGYELRIGRNNQGGEYFSLRDMNESGLEIGAGTTPEAAIKNAGRRINATEPLEDALKYEGEVMGHCVGGYCPDVMEGRSRIFSLRDAKGQPHVTVEVRPGIIEPRMNGDVKLPDEINQIKGKANRAPKDEYLPFVQDFVRSGQWGAVGDIRNTGLIPIDSTSDLAKSIRAAGGEPPRFVTQQELTELLRQNANPAKGYARGGAVSAYDPDEIDTIVSQLKEEFHA